MNRVSQLILAALLFLLGFVPSPAGEVAKGTRYTGSVGKLEAVFVIQWQEDGGVSGTYFYPSRPGVVYRLAGSNHEAGQLYLEEFTGRKLSARCYLRKHLSEDLISWKGEMRNTDGRVLDMVLKRKRANVPNLVTMPPVVFPDYYSRVPERVIWAEPPRADVPVEMANISYEGSHFCPARVDEFVVGENSTMFRLTLGVYPGNRMSLPLQVFDASTTLTIPRRLELPAELMKKEIVWLELSDEGSIRGINVIPLVVTHYRKSPGGKLEVRCLLSVSDRPGISDYEISSDNPGLQGLPEFFIVPDKLSLPRKHELDSPSELWVQTLRVTEEFGTAIQLMEAGAGILELETIALEGPWIPVETMNGWDDTPATQRTIGAG